MDLLIYYKNNASGWAAGVVWLPWGEGTGAALSPHGPQGRPAAPPLPGTVVQAAGAGRAGPHPIFARAARRPVLAGSEAPGSPGWPWRARWTCPEARGGRRQRGSWGLPGGSSVRGWRAACSVKEKVLDEGPARRGGRVGTHRLVPTSAPGQSPLPVCTNSELSSCFIRCLSRGCTAGSLR